MCHESSAYDQESNSKCTFYGGCNSQDSVMFIALGTFQLENVKYIYHRVLNLKTRHYSENQLQGGFATRQVFLSEYQTRNVPRHIPICGNVYSNPSTN